MSATKEKAEKVKKPRKAKAARKNPVIAEMIELGKRIKSVRESKSITQSDLASKLKTTSQDVGQVENGWRSISVPRVYHLAKALGVTPEWLFTGINPKIHTALVVGAKNFTKAVEAMTAEEVPVEAAPPAVIEEKPAAS